MAMVNRYRKSGGFNELLKVLETCNVKKREHIMRIIHSETPQWAHAIEQKSISFSTIISWESKVLSAIVSDIPIVLVVMAFKSLPPNEYEQLLQKLSQQERRKVEIVADEIKPSSTEIVSGVLKFVGEVRDLISKGTIKVEKIDPNLHIPHNFEASLVKPVTKTIGNPIVETKAFQNLPSKVQRQAAFKSIDMPFNLATETRPEVLKNKIRELTQHLALVLQQNIQLKQEIESKNKAA